jgi:hypothetical protein
MDQLQQLKGKYGPALDGMAHQGIQVTQTTLKDNKLYVEAYAPSQDAKNAVWNQIKAIDSNFSDLTCDIKVGSAPAATAAAGAGAGGAFGLGNLGGASPQSLASGLAAAFHSDQTPAFPSMLSNMFSNSDGQQRAGLLNQILASAGPGLLGGALSGPLANILRGGATSVTPEQAQQISPAQVQDLAEHAQKANPSIVEQVSGFYAQHPKVIQALGAGALAMVMAHMKKSE